MIGARFHHRHLSPAHSLSTIKFGGELLQGVTFLVEHNDGNNDVVGFQMLWTS